MALMMEIPTLRSLAFQSLVVNQAEALLDDLPGHFFVYEKEKFRHLSSDTNRYKVIKIEDSLQSGVENLQISEEEKIEHWREYALGDRRVM